MIISLQIILIQMLQPPPPPFPSCFHLTFRLSVLTSVRPYACPSFRRSVCPSFRLSVFPPFRASIRIFFFSFSCSQVPEIGIRSARARTRSMASEERSGRKAPATPAPSTTSAPSTPSKADREGQDRQVFFLFCLFVCLKASEVRCKVCLLFGSILFAVRAFL